MELFFPTWTSFFPLWNSFLFNRTLFKFNFNDNNDDSNDDNKDDNIAYTLEATKTASKAYTEKTLGIALGAAQIESTANIVETLRSTPVMKEATGNVVEGSCSKIKSKLFTVYYIC